MLLRKCRKGDAKAQFAIYKAYYKQMYNVALRILNHTAEAEDVMQEAFLAAFDKLDAFSGEVSFGAWLRRIVVNRALDALRQRKMQLEDVDNVVVKADEELVDDADSKLAMVKKVMGGLPDNQRILLNLYLFEGYSHEEIATILDMKHGAVRTAYARARLRLREELELMQVAMCDE